MPEITTPKKSLMSQQKTFKYVDLAQTLIRDFADRNLSPGDRLGTENELVDEYGLSRTTVRQALAILEEDGLIYRKRKKGTFIKKSFNEFLDLETTRGTVIVAISNDYNLDPNIDYASFVVFRTVERTLADLGFSIRVVGLGSDEPRDRDRLISALRDDDVDAICSIGSCLEPHRNLITAIPVISVCTFYPTTLPWVGIDMENVAFECVDYLLARHHREIAMICGSWIDNTAMGDLARGYRRAFDRRKTPFDRQRIHHAYDGESLVELVRSVLASKNRPTAIFAEDWRIAHATMTVGAELKLNIPEHLSLIGCGQNVTRIDYPAPVTAYVPDYEATGQKIAEIILSIGDGEDLPQAPIKLSGHIVDHGSVRQVNEPVAT